MHFCQIFGLSKVLTGRGNGSQKGITRSIFGYQKGITRRGSGHQIFLQEEDLVMKYSYRKKIWSSNILTGYDLIVTFFARKTIATLGPTWNSTQLEFLQVFDCKLGLREAGLCREPQPPSHPPTHPTA